MSGFLPTSPATGPAFDPALRSRVGESSLLKNRTILDRLRSGERGGDPQATRQALRQVSREFEAVFLNQLVSAMRKTVGDSGLLEKSQGEKMFESMLDEEWAKNLAGRHGPGGLSEMIYRQLSRRLDLEETELPPLRSGTHANPRVTPDHPLLQPTTATPPPGLR